MQMNKKQLGAFAKEAAKGIKTPEDLNQFSQMLKKITVEAAINAEMGEHLGYERPRSPPRVIAATAKLASALKPKTASLITTLRVIVTTRLSLS